MIIQDTGTLIGNNLHKKYSINVVVILNYTTAVKFVKQKTLSANADKVFYQYYSINP